MRLSEGVRQQNYDFICACWRQIVDVAENKAAVLVLVDPWRPAQPDPHYRDAAFICEHDVAWHVQPAPAQRDRWSTQEGRNRWEADMQERWDMTEPFLLPERFGRLSPENRRLILRLGEQLLEEQDRHLNKQTDNGE
jgi:hypothetical protein